MGDVKGSMSEAEFLKFWKEWTDWKESWQVPAITNVSSQLAEKCLHVIVGAQLK